MSKTRQEKTGKRAPLASTVVSTNTEVANGEKYQAVSIPETRCL